MKAARECLDTRKAGGCSGYVSRGAIVRCGDCPALTREPTIADRLAAAEELAELERRADMLGRRSHNIFTGREMDGPWPEQVTESARQHWRKHGLEMDKASRRDAAYEILEFVKETDR